MNTKYRFRSSAFALLIILALVALCAATGCGGGSGSNAVAPSSGVASPVTPASGQGGTVQGVVMDAESEVPLDQALVSIGAKSATSDSQGNYVLAGIPAGSQTITVTRKDYQALTDRVQVADGQETDMDLLLDTTIDVWLDHATKYAWQVEAVKEDGTTTPGPVWYFTTDSAGKSALKSVPMPVSQEAAARVALSLLAQEGKDGHSIGSVEPIASRKGVLLAWFFALKPAGYIVVPASQAVTLPPVLAYSFDSPADLRDPELKKRIRLIRLDVELRLAALGDRNYSPGKNLEKNRALWESSLAGTPAEETGRAVIGPILATTWHQFEPYNKYCPMDPDTKERCITGCVATAYGQIMNRWQKPKSIIFEPASKYSYTTGRKKIAVDAGTAGISSISYNFANTDADTIARLCFALGVIGKMNYTSDISTSNTFIFGKAIKDFGYEETRVRTFASSEIFTTDLLDADLNAQYPVAMRLNKQNDDGDLYGGHCVVCDGFDNSSGTKYYHFNMGRYDKKGNDWYSLPAGLPLKYSVVGGYVCNIVPVNELTRGAKTARAASPQNPYPRDGDTGFEVNEALLWDDVDDAVSYNCYVWKATGEKPALPTFTNLPYAGASSEYLPSGQ